MELRSTINLCISVVFFVFKKYTHYTVLDWIFCVPTTPLSYAEALTHSMAVFAVRNQSRLKEVIRVGSWSDWISVLLRKDIRELFLSLFSIPHPKAHMLRKGLCKPGIEGSPEWISWKFNLRLLASRTVRKLVFQATQFIFCCGSSSRPIYCLSKAKYQQKA